MSVAKKEILQNDYISLFPHFHRNKPLDSEYFPGNSKTLPICHRNGMHPHYHGKSAIRTNTVIAWTTPRFPKRNWRPTSRLQCSKICIIFALAIHGVWLSIYRTSQPAMHKRKHLWKRCGWWLRSMLVAQCITPLYTPLSSHILVVETPVVSIAEIISCGMILQKFFVNTWWKSI